MWNYSYMLPSILFLYVFVFFYLTRPRLNIKISRTFFAILIVEFFASIFGILLSFANDNYANFSQHFLSLLNTIYFTLFLFRVYLFFIFTIDILKYNYSDKTKKRIVRSVLAVSCALVMFSFWWGIVFRIDEDGYHSGPLYFIPYVCSLTYIALSLALIRKHGKQLSKFERIGAIIYNLMLVVGSVFQIFFPKELIMDVFCVVAIIVIYLYFQNPELYMSDRGKAFNMKAFKAIIDENINNNTFRMLGFALRNYNDERGIYSGDQMDKVIALITEFIHEKFPQYVVFYLRSGRFVIFDPEALNLYRVRDDLYERFQQPWCTDEATIYLDISFVKISAEAKMTSTDRLIDNTIIAFEKAAKSTVAGTVMIDLDNTQEIEHQVYIKRALENAVDNDTVEIFLQPVVDSKTRNPVGAEALARIRDENGKIISPGLFIPIAEQNGQINEMGEQVFKKTCKFINSGAFEKLGFSWINVNLSPVQCMRRDLSDRFKAILDEYNVPVQNIHLEITEQYMEDFSELSRQVNNLKNVGFLFALDDYGSGYSNLTRVKKYPFFNIKLDMEIVWDYYNERDSLIYSLVQAFKQMGYTITAEGIETEEMADLMASIGCDYLQGYYFSKPLTIDELMEKFACP